jgi:hypothetical protein
MVSAEHEDINEPLQKRASSPPAVAKIDGQPPRTPSTKFVSLVPLSLKGDEGIKALIKSSIPRLQTIINAYLENDVRLPLWQAQQGSDEMRSHIANLKIPAATPYSPFPSLLLHNWANYLMIRYWQTVLTGFSVRIWS